MAFLLDGLEARDCAIGIGWKLRRQKRMTLDDSVIRYERGMDLSLLPILKIDVLYENERGIIVINKPAGMDTFNTNFHKSGYPQLSDVMRKYWPEGGPPHRIDRGTSGIHIWGSKRSAMSELKKGWATRAHKTYLAVAAKVPEFTYSEVTMDIKANDAKIDKWKPCTTGLTRLNDSRLVAAELLMGGRTHQIRRCMKAVGLPLDGDYLYGGNGEAGGKYVYHQMKFKPRFLLHAWKWEFDEDLKYGEGDISVQASLPEDMAEWETGGYTPAMWSFEVPPLTPSQYERLDHFRRNNVGGSLRGYLDE